MLKKIYYLYKNSPKRLRELREIGSIFEKTGQKPSKSIGTRWIAHKVRAMEIILANYDSFGAHIECLSQTDSQALNKLKLKV